MAQVRFIHAADTHLGTPFRGAGAQDPLLREALVEAGYGAFERTISYAINQGVDFVVLAGDVYDAQSFSGRATAALLKGARELEQAGIALYLLHGNHDPLTSDSRLAKLPDNVHVFPSGSVGWFDHVGKSGATCRLYGRSFSSSVERESFTAEYRRHPGVELAVGVMHTMLGDRPGHSPYAPSSESELRAAGMDYWALGHVHLREVISPSNPAIVYPGSAQACNASEVGPHGCYLVTLDGGVCDLTWLPTGVVNPRVVSVDLTDCTSLAEARSAVLAMVDLALDGEPDSSILRLKLTGVRRFPEPLTGDESGELLNLVREHLSSHRPVSWVSTRIQDESRRFLDTELEQSSNAFIRSMAEAAEQLDPSDVLDGSSPIIRDLPISEREQIAMMLSAESSTLIGEALERAYYELMEGGGSR